MEVVWPLPCHTANSYFPNGLLTSSQRTIFNSKVSGTGYLAVSIETINKYVKHLCFILIAGDTRLVACLMANSSASPSCSFKDRAMDSRSSSNHGEDHAVLENDLLPTESHFHLPGDSESKPCEKVPAAASFEPSSDLLLSAGKGESLGHHDYAKLNLGKSTDYVMNFEDAPAALDSTKSEKKLVSPGVSVDVFPESRLCRDLLATGIDMENEHFIEDAKQNTMFLSRPSMGMPASDTNRSSHSDNASNVSLRAWLSNSTRVIEKVENLHIFKQIAEFVDLAHSQGVVLRNVRPSSFLLSSMSRVSIIESASSGTSSGSSADSTGRVAAMGFADGEGIGPSMLRRRSEDVASAQQMDYEAQEEIPAPIAACDQGISQSGKGCASSRHIIADNGRQQSHFSNDKLSTEELEGGCSTSSSSEHAEDRLNDRKFPLKEILSLELMCYRSPEEINGGTPNFSSDVYSLGVLFLELFYSPSSQVEWSRAMSDLRHRLLPPSLLLNYPKEAAFCLLLLHPNPECRPKTRDIVHADVFHEIEDKLVEREAIMKLEEKLAEAETTLDFLLQLQQRKSSVIQNVAKELSLLDEDIRDVESWKTLILKNRQKLRFDSNSCRPLESPKSDIAGSKFLDDQPLTHEEVLASGCSKGARRQELLLAKSSQLLKSFNNLKEAYLSVRKREHCHSSQLTYDSLRPIGVQQGSHAEKMVIPRVVNSFEGLKSDQGEGGGRLGCFFDEFCKFMKYSRLDVKATLQYGDILNTKNMVCSVSFDCDNEFFATAGVSKRIKIFDCNTLLEDATDMHYPVVEMNSRTKLSCVCWSNFRKNCLVSSDLGGVVQLWDVTAGRTIMEFKEHGKCAWSVDFSHSDPSKLASGSDDCCVKIWSANQDTSVGTIRTKANICSVQFSPDHSQILAFGSADSQVYFHDLRYIRIPVCILTGHQKAVSFIKFAGPAGIVSASTDNTLKLWDLSNTSMHARTYGAGFGSSRNECLTTYSGHTNVKNFVGLSVAKENYIACGSETNEVFVYHASLPVAMLSYKFKNADPISGRELEDVGDQFVSSVCWRNKSQILVTANSVGNIQVLEMV